MTMKAGEVTYLVTVALPVACNFFQFAAVMTPKLRLKISAAVNRVYVGCE
jgi:hypothetical protein